MNTKFKRASRGQLRNFARAGDIKSVPSLIPARLWHVYVKLEFQQQYETAATKSDGESFVRNVARAAQSIELVLAQEDGIVVEVQGSVIHCLIPDEYCDAAYSQSLCRSMNEALHLTFTDSSRVEGWRMTMDWGKTLLVQGRGIHDDDSYVSLGNAANAPAKHLYAQLSLPSEDNRSLKRFMLGWRAGSQHTWTYQRLSHEVSESFRKMASERISEIKRTDFSVQNVLSKQAREFQEVRAKAAPIPSPGSNYSSSEDPIPLFGWVMRADIDGFTARVEQCFDDDAALQSLGESFEEIMDKAAEFAEKHDELLVQLPWAGDNFTAVVVFSDKDAYDEAIETTLVDFALDFSEAMNPVVKLANFKGWAQTAAGGNVHGNSLGNVYVGSVQFEGRRFLIGAGQGVGRSSQAFIDMQPDSGELVVFEEDYSALLKPYQEQLKSRKKKDETQSTLFRIGQISNLQLARQTVQAKLSQIREPAKSLITVGATGKVLASSRDYGEA